MKLVVKNSPIDGLGVFAVRRIERGELIGTYDGSPTSVDSKYVLWLIDDDGSVHGIKGCNEMRYLNHASDANADFHNTDIYAIRDIEPGAEITVHYGSDWES